MEHPPIAVQIWDKKYRFKDANGNPIDKSVEDTWERIANALAIPEDDQLSYSVKFRAALEDYQFLPAGRITAGAGTGRQVTLFNCYVMGTIPDSMDGIFSMLREAALTMQQGGGIGYDFSTLRPKGAEVKGVAADASGPLTFMDVWDSMCRTVMSAGERRGAMMATMRCDHPDIEDFITAKKDAARLRMFNLSVLVTDDFMEAVRTGAEWPLVHKKPPPHIADRLGNGQWIYKTVDARELWNKIIRTTYDVAEPGVIFIDRINTLNNLGYCETISSTNPCGEQPLPPYGACLLGSINMARLVKAAFTNQASLDLDHLDQLVATAVRMMDNVIDVSNFPVPQQVEEARTKRRIGLGVTGLADALAMCQIKYGTAEAAQQVEEWMEAIALSAYSASIELAKEKGPFPLFDAEGFLRKGSFAAERLPIEMQDDIRQHGIRNALLTSIAPTGTISLYAGNVSSGIEPIFAYGYTRKVLQADGSKVEEEVVDYAVALYQEMHPGEELPDYFTTAQHLKPSEHLRMQAAAQHWVDSSISKTINVPEDISFEDFRNVYEDAYDEGCKGCTTYRPNDVTGSVLEVKTDKPKAAAPGNNPAERPKRLEGATYKLKWPNEPHAFYITFTDQIDDAGGRRPFEVFINSKNVDHFQWTVALTRMVSAVFRRGGNVSFVAGELREVFDPKGGAWMSGQYVPSLLAAIGNIVAEHMTEIGYGDFKGAQIVDQETEGEVEIVQTTVFPQHKCKDCGSFNLKVEGGCEVCKDCGSSKCG
ncbi:MAG: putative ribonucleoside-diphosphate reductase subunit alpha [Prokaryotic dsDNA virus sp.]|nr:MAG: putative ribonucleoside-diphosphate reductase subunit alpha [Prokaryotic dsDNA virus sp.]